ncbi:hypothetical protein VNI00_003520 [Paramarasmius palmivorus]|uniref:Cytochrome P450 n=1 Tax=Paramarasmius palmivorus TaxID=297713 RepID=A0AAW0DU46_9AGAR
MALCPSNFDGATLLFGGLIVLLTLKYTSAHRARSKLDAIPTAGPNGVLSSYYTAWRYMFDGCSVIEEGCREFPHRAFKIPTFDGWQVVVHGPKLLDDVRRASENELSIIEAVDDIIKARYTISPLIHINPYHVNVIRNTLTRNIGAKFEDIRDEISAAFNDNILFKNHDWVEVSAVEVVRNIVVRANNRVFVGLPLCRDIDYCNFNVQFTIDVALNSAIIGLFPAFLHPLVGRIFTKKRKSISQATRYLVPIIEERLKMQQEYGTEWAGKSNDYISWLIDAMEHSAEEWQKSVEDLVLKVLCINFASIHTTSMAFTHALYRLAANPSLAGPLREELEAAVSMEGWTKGAMSRLRLMDSFIKESQRRAGGAIAVARTATRDFQFSDGSFVPAGTKIAAATYNAHQNEVAYPAPESFKPTRFAELRDAEGESIKHQLVTPTLDWLSFGIGKRACPGRFFAANELKLMLAHILINYDVKFKGDAGYPSPFIFAGTIVPNQSAKVMFRKRLDL